MSETETGPPAPPRGRPSLRWRAAAPVVFVLAGALFVVSALSSDGTDLRASRFDNLGQLVNNQSKQVDGLKRRAAALNDEVDTLSSRIDDRAVRRLQTRIDALDGPAGMQPVHGPGVTVTLSDAPETIIESADIEPEKLLVHQQDIQAVANALWSGGAEALTIQDQRIISTTGIKCVGNVVILHGIPYSPPYRISAIGDPASLQAALEASPYVTFYKQYTDKYQLGYAEEVSDRLDMAAFTGSPSMDYAVVPTRTPARAAVTR